MANKANKNNTRGIKVHKLTKAETYAKRGILYNPETTKILSPIGWINELLKIGNEKVGRTVLTWSTCPGTDEYTAVVNDIEYTVLGTCICNCKECYAQTGHYNQTSCITSLVINTYLINFYPDFVDSAIRAQLDYAGLCELRVHAAGDFNTKDPDSYAKMWYDIARDYPRVTMWTYTKIGKYETLFDEFLNANVVKSIIPHVGVNYGKCEYIIKAYEFLKSIGESVYICRCGIDSNQHCANCGVCVKYEYVLFVEHSTGYNAKKDPLYNELVKLIESQED